MFVDASAIVAILTEEQDGFALAARLDGAEDRFTSPIAVWESAASISRKSKSMAQGELRLVEKFLDSASIRVESITAQLTREAVVAFDRYGRRSGHPADLNLGDCFAYAFAKSLAVPLLFTGKDFSLTDVQSYSATKK
ncbi:MAG: type II toxin-antitoxin system VapC family toxin [Aestuariivirga sp.]